MECENELMKGKIAFWAVRKAHEKGLHHKAIALAHDHDVKNRAFDKVDYIKDRVHNRSHFRR